jgi:hypothetical protein
VPFYLHYQLLHFFTNYLFFVYLAPSKASRRNPRSVPDASPASTTSPDNRKGAGGTVVTSHNITAAGLLSSNPEEIHIPKVKETIYQGMERILKSLRWVAQ